MQHPRYEGATTAGLKTMMDFVSQSNLYVSKRIINLLRFNILIPSAPSPPSGCSLQLRATFRGVSTEVTSALCRGMYAQECGDG
jgi:hypothetical protein